MDSGSIQADFFLPGIALDFMHVRHALADGFPNPFVQLAIYFDRACYYKRCCGEQTLVG